MKRCLHMELSIISNNWLEDCTDRIGTYLSIRLVMWPGARPFSALYVVNKILTWQCIVWWGASADHSIKILGIMCSNFLLLNTSQYFCICLRDSSRHSDQLTHGGKTINVLLEEEKTLSLCVNCRGRKTKKTLGNTWKLIQTLCIVWSMWQFNVSTVMRTYSCKARWLFVNHSPY